MVWLQPAKRVSDSLFVQAHQPSSSSEQLSSLQEVLASHVLPRLPLQTLRSFSQTCVAARAAVSSLPDAVLTQLAQVRLSYLLSHMLQDAAEQLYAGRASATQ